MEDTQDVFKTLSRFAEDVASIVPSVDAETDGEYGSGLGSEPEERQVELLLDALTEQDEAYQATRQEVGYPNQTATCDIVLPGQIPVEAKLLRYWRANGDPEDFWYTHVFSPFNKNTLLTDAKRLHEADFQQPGGILGLFYQRAVDDGESVKGLKERFTPTEMAEKVAHEIEYWYDFGTKVCRVAPFRGLQHSIHQRGAAITWTVY